MSRYYGMKVTVRGYQASPKGLIVEKLQELWDFEAPDVLQDGTLELAGEDHLTAGMLDCEFATELARAVWEPTAVIARWRSRVPIWKSLRPVTSTRGARVTTGSGRRKRTRKPRKQR